ncbi:hypothetical protein G7Y89_g13047 [Cudoniella acicularis]|uniref:Uncharacterized protein n=1 Tax=Cudoniella acicularis TaxID=354080 RepID=A0A8H4RAA0_9HELO|nr:hypothetical protein G7Y89_g13047 [Cudoniella acicularis]
MLRGALAQRKVRYQIFNLPLLQKPDMASATNFQPHGLIKTPMQQQFYNKAHIANVNTGIADPKEHETVALMEVVLYKNIFTEDYFAVTSEQPAGPESQRHCEIVIKYLENGSESIRTLCFGECKRTKTSQAFSLKALEEQAADYSRLDIGNDVDGLLVEECFNEMKLWPPTPHAGQTSSNYTSYRSANASSHSASYNNNNNNNNAAEALGGYSLSYETQTGQQGGYAVPSIYEGFNPTGASSSSNKGQYSDASGPSSAWNQYASQVPANDSGSMSGRQEHTGGSREGAHEVVRVTKVPHMTRPDEFLFKDGRGHTRTTSKSDWTKTMYGGKVAWLYQGRKTTYVTHDKIPT